MVTKKQVGMGAGALATVAAAAAAGYYFYASTDAKQHRKVAAKWANAMKKDVHEQAKKLKKIEKAQVMKIIEKASAVHKAAKSADPKEVMRAAKELKDNWKEIAHEIGVGGKKVLASAAKRAGAKKPTRAKRAK